MPSPHTIALVHDYLLSYGGAERVLQEMAAVWPDAPIYTLMYDEDIVKRYFPRREVHASFLQRLPRFLRRHYRWLLPLYPVAVESLDLRDFDVVISSSGAWSKGIVTRLYTKHIAYLHSPMRFAWDAHEEAIAGSSSRKKIRVFRRALLSYLRVWDREAAERPDAFLVNSRYTLDRVKKYYRRAGEVVFPPALRLFERFGKADMPEQKRDYFLVVARLTASKKVDLVVEAFNKLKLPLVIVGTGRDEERLKKQAEKNIVFRGEVDDATLANLYQGARALIQPSIEDFGLVAAEALSFGTPVIAYDEGGAKEMVTPGVTGELFYAGTPEILADGVRRFIERETQYSKEAMRLAVEPYGSRAFQNSLKHSLDQVITHHTPL